MSSGGYSYEKGVSVYEEKYRPFVVTAIVGCVLWIISGGFLHAYVICPDLKRLGESTIETLVGGRPFLALVFMGLLFGLGVEVAKFCGAALQSEIAVMLAPITVGATMGGLQGAIVPTEIWGFSESVIFHSANTRVVSGAVCGLILTVPTIMIGVKIRSMGKPW